MNELAPTAEPAHAAVYVAFPGFGRRYLAIFPEFRFELAFSLLGSATWTRLLDDGSRGPSETVKICVDSVGDGLYFVSWRESNGTTVAHVEDFTHRTLITHIRRIDGTFLRANGTLIELLPVSLRLTTSPASQHERRRAGSWPGHDMRTTRPLCATRSGERVSIDQKLLGLLAIADPLKATTAAALQELARAGVRVVMATGDGQATAAAVARTRHCRVPRRGVTRREERADQGTAGARPHRRYGR